MTGCWRIRTATSLHRPPGQELTFPAGNEHDWLERFDRPTSRKLAGRFRAFVQVSGAAAARRPRKNAYPAPCVPGKRMTRKFWMSPGQCDYHKWRMKCPFQHRRILIPQSQLARIQLFRQTIRELQSELNLMRSEVIAALDAGADIEAGDLTVYCDESSTKHATWSVLERFFAPQVCAAIRRQVPPRVARQLFIERVDGPNEADEESSNDY